MARRFRSSAASLWKFGFEIVGMNELRPAPVLDLLEGQAGELQPIAG